MADKPETLEEYFDRLKWEMRNDYCLPMAGPDIERQARTWARILWGFRTVEEQDAKRERQRQEERRNEEALVADGNAVAETASEDSSE